MIQFQLQDFAFESLHFRRIAASHPAKESSEPIEINQRIRIRGDLQESTMSVSLAVEIGEPGLPFEVGVHLVGQFLFSEIPVQQELDQIVQVNCAAILFPFVREAIAELTRKGGIGPILLPPLNFVELHRESKSAVLEPR
jgi:preprotein translocase subunit SecB